MNRPVSRADIEHMLAHTADIWHDIRGARIFITGGTGFVGSWLLEAFVAANAAFDLNAQAVLLTRDPAGFRARAAHLADAPGISLVIGDTATFDFPDGPFSHVVHAATERSYPADAKRPLGILADDARATRRVLELCVRAGARTLLFTSSGAVYGRQPAQCSHVSEDDPFAPDTTDTHSAYGQSKRLSEFTCVMHGAAAGFAVKIARLFAFVGPRLPLDEGYAVGSFVRDALAGTSIRISGDGTPLRSYLYAADLAVWLWRILVRGAAGRAYNVGSPDAVSIFDVARSVVRATDPRLAIDVAVRPAMGAVPSRYVPSTARAGLELGLQPIVAFPQGLERMIDWYRTREHMPHVEARDFTKPVTRRAGYGTGALY